MITTDTPDLPPVPQSDFEDGNNGAKDEDQAQEIGFRHDEKKLSVILGAAAAGSVIAFFSISFARFA